MTQLEREILKEEFTRMIENSKEVIEKTKKEKGDNMKEEVNYYSDFRVNDKNFDDYEEAKAFKQKLLDANQSVVFSGYDNRIDKRVNFYLYNACPKFEHRPLNMELALCKKYWSKNDIHNISKDKNE